MQWPPRPPLVRIFRFDPEAERIEIDAYGVEVEQDRVRGRGCKHRIPCLVFVCISSHHRGSRLTGWCFGADDANELRHRLGEDEYQRLLKNAQYRPRDLKYDRGWCDDCWVKTMRGYVNKRVRDFQRYKNHTRTPLHINSITAYREHLWSRGTWIPEKAQSKRHE